MTDLPPPVPPPPPPPPPSGDQWPPPQAPPFPPGYPPPVYAPPPMASPWPQGPPTSDDRTWALLCHLSIFVFGLLGPLIVLLTKGNESRYIKDQAVETLNFHITLLIASIASIVLMLVLVGFLTFFATLIGGYVFGIIGAIAANRGEAYRYPINLRLVKP